MSYVTKQGLVERFGEVELVQLTDRTNIPVSTIDDAVVGRAIADASAFADGYISKAIALPLAVAPPALGKAVADIARYYLHGSSADKDSQVTRAYNEAVSFLRDVAKGVVQLGDGITTPAPAGGGQVRASAPARVFTRDSLRYL
jgi:phage gp36-like protein